MGQWCSTVAPRGVAPILPFRGLEVHRSPHGLAPRGRKGRWNTVPSLVCALMTEVDCGGSPVFETRASCVARLQTLQRWSASSLRGALSPYWPDGLVGAGAIPHQ